MCEVVKMDRQIQNFPNRLSYASIAVATLTLGSLFFLRPPETSLLPLSSVRFPESSCAASSRSVTTLEKRNNRLWSTSSWLTKVSSYANFFGALGPGLLRNDSRVLCVFAGAGHSAAGLGIVGVSDVTAVELVASPPLVSRADPHNLPFSDGEFDLAFVDKLADALFPDRVAAEMERTVRAGGACVVANFEEDGADDAAGFAGLFRNSEPLEVVNFTLSGLRMTSTVMRKNKIPS